jgi:hypothetical protein
MTKMWHVILHTEVRKGNFYSILVLLLKHRMLFKLFIGMILWKDTEFKLTASETHH